MTAAAARIAARLLPYLAAIVLGLTGCGVVDSPPQVASTPAPKRSQGRPVPDMRHMRAVHMMGNWLGNTRGFEDPALNEAPALSAASATIHGNLSSFIDGNGVSHTNDLAVVTLTRVSIGTATYPQAGFWVIRDKGTGAAGLQFRPQMDSSLAGIPGFSGDVFIGIPAAGQSAAPADISGVTGVARDFVLAVIAHAPEIVGGATATLESGAALGEPYTLAQTLGTLRAAWAGADDVFFARMKAMNVEWLGVSVAMHYDSYSDPTVRTHVCPGGSMTDSGGNSVPCTFPDADLVGFLGRARARGFKIYLTLAFESSADLDRLPSPACGDRRSRTSSPGAASRGRPAPRRC